MFFDQNNTQYGDYRPAAVASLPLVEVITGQ